MDGVTMRKLESTYVWSPVERTEFSVGVVTPVSYHIEVLRTLQIPEGKFNLTAKSYNMKVLGFFGFEVRNR